MTSSQPPVDATLGGIVPVTLSGVRLSMQPEQQPPDIALVKLHPFLSSLPIAGRQAWSTQKTTQAPLPGTYEAAEVFAGMQYSAVPKKPGEERNGWKVSRMTEV